MQFTLRSFFGLEPPALIVQKGHRSTKLRETPQQNALHEAVLEAALGRDAAIAKAKADQDAYEDRMAQRMKYCSYLGCINTEPPDGSVKFSRCKPCFDQMKRQVLYCSASVTSLMFSLVRVLIFSFC